MKNGRHRTTAAWRAAALAASLAVGSGAALAQAAMPERPLAAAQVVAAAEAPPPGERVRVDAGARVSQPPSTAKQEEAPLPTSSGFVLLGLGVVLVRVVARHRRGFRRSGTILLR